MSSDYGYSMRNLPPPQKQESYNPAIAETYNNGNGFTPLAANNRGSILFQNKNSTNSNGGPSQSRSTNRPEYSNGGAAAGRSCLVVPTFGSGKKKKKKEKADKIITTPTQKNRGGGYFSGRNSSSTDSVSTSAESSMPDPYQTYRSHNDKQSLMKSFNKKQESGNKDAREWYLETMVEEDENADQEISRNNSNPTHSPLQFRAQEQPQTQTFSQFRQPQRQTMGTRDPNYRATTNPAPSNNALPNLLQLPKAEDRGHEARRRQDKMHAYQGEMEPEGVRGQEAKVVTRPMSNSNEPQMPGMRDFANSPHSGTSSQLLPIHQVVSNRQRQVQNSLQMSERGQNNQSEITPQKRTNKSRSVQAMYSPGYEERMNIASSVLSTGRFPQETSSYSGYDDDVDHEEMMSHNRAEFEREYRQQQQPRQRRKQVFVDGGPSVYSHNESVGSEDLRSLDTPKSKSSRQSAPVSIDDASFQNPLEHIQGIHAMAMEHVTKGEYDLALQAFKQVLNAYIKEHGEAHPLTASAHHNLGTVHTKRAALLPENTLHQRHCREQALACFQAAARSARDCPTLGPNHPNVAVSLVRIGFLLLQSRQYENAVITFEEALRIRKENYGLYHGLVANLFNNLGVCHMHLQQFPEGRRHLQQALNIQRQLLAEEGDDSSTALLELADTLCNIGGLNLEWIRRQGPDARHALDAESAFVEALELRSKVLGENHALTTQVRSLHDMVRSLPMPTAVTPSAAKGEDTNRGKEFSPPRSKTNTSGSDYSPAANSVGTGKSNAKSILSTAETLDTSADIVNTSALSIPSLKFPVCKSPHPQNSRNVMDINDATEESCLLRKPGHDEETASQAGGFVSYARSTVSVGSGSNVENDRVATIRQAKDVLDSHQEFMYPPGRNKFGEQTERTIDERDGNAYEDGLVPLEGNWPGPRNINRLSPSSLTNPSENLHTIHNCAVSYLAKGRQTEAVALLEMVVECQKQKNGPLHEHVGSAVHNVGIAYLRSEVYYKAFQAFEEAVRVRKAALGRNHPAVAVSLVKFGISLMLLQRHEDSLWIFRDALTIRKQALGDLHPSNARICNNIGCVHVELGKLEEARKDFESALDIQRNALLQNSEDGAMIFGASTTLQNLGYLYGKKNMHEKAAMVLRESLSLQERIMPQEHPTVLITLESLAEACLDAQRFTHALKYYRELFDRSQSVEPLDCVKQATTLQTMASIHAQLDDPKSQKKKLEMALQFIRSMNLEPRRENEVRAFEDRLLGELEVAQGLLLSKQDRNNWV